MNTSKKQMGEEVTKAFESRGITGLNIPEKSCNALVEAAQNCDTSKAKSR